MREYEITYISDPNLAEDARGQLDAAIDGAIEQLKGSISYNSPNSRRRLSYPIKKQGVGFVRTLQVMLDPVEIGSVREVITKINGALRVSILQTSKREEVTTSIFEAAAKRQVEPKIQKKAEPVSAAEVDKKIAEALEEEVK
jgi:ribosomal protein S6